MLLNYKKLEAPESLTMFGMHGLLGSLRNRASVGRSLSENFRVITLDSRNHGSSFMPPHLLLTVWSKIYSS